MNDETNRYNFCVEPSGLKSEGTIDLSQAPLSFIHFSGVSSDRIYRDSLWQLKSRKAVKNFPID